MLLSKTFIIFAMYSSITARDSGKLGFKMSASSGRQKYFYHKSLLIFNRGLLFPGPNLAYFMRKYLNVRCQIDGKRKVLP
jgi:hypothetical protein